MRVMRPSRRSGKTLIEMVFIITAIGVVTAISGKTMIVVLNKERSGRDAFIANSDRSRLASDFRRDVNAADAAELSGDDDRQIDLHYPENKVIEYRIADDELTRREMQGETLIRQERYHIGHAAAQFGIESGDPELVSITAEISHHPENSSAPERQLKIEAVTGKDLRFTEGTP